MRRVGICQLISMSLQFRARIITTSVNEDTIRSRATRSAIVHAAIVHAELTLTRANHHHPDQLSHHWTVPAHTCPVPGARRASGVRARGTTYVMTAKSQNCDIGQQISLRPRRTKVPPGPGELLREVVGGLTAIAAAPETHRRAE
jgi:hypothetical protein